MSSLNLNIENFFGLNESSDGDSGLKMGEAVDMTNFRITEEGNLKKIWGYYLYTSGSSSLNINGMIFWNDLLIYACGSSVYTYNGTTRTNIGGLSSNARTLFFAFDEKLYILCNGRYFYWDGKMSVIATVDGYVPTVLISSNPTSGAGTEYEAINMLSESRIQRFNGDGTTTDYILGEKNIKDIVEIIVGDRTLLKSKYDLDIDDDGTATVIFDNAPKTGLDNVSIEYRKDSSENGVTDRFKGDGSSRTFHLSSKEIDNIYSVTVGSSDYTDYSADLEEGTITLDDATSAAIVVKWTKVIEPNVKDMKYAELFGGANNTRVFLYGDGSNTIFYSEPMEGATKASAEYFPELNRMDVGSDDTAVTALVPFYDRLFIFKEDSVYYCRYSTMTGDDGDIIITFLTAAVTKSVGCLSYKGALKTPNGIVFPAADGIYRISGTSVYEQMSENIISKRVRSSYSAFDKNSVLALNHSNLGECWFINGTDILVYNYRNDTWYKYKLLETPVCLYYHEGDVYFGNVSGQVFLFDENRLSFNGSNISAYWESGSMDFGYFNKRKWIDRIWLTLKMEANSRVTISLESDITSDYPDKTYNHGKVTFISVNFSNFSFSTNDKPAVNIARIKAKKFAFLKLILSNDSSTDTCTVMNITAPVTVGCITK